MIERFAIAACAVIPLLLALLSHYDRYDAQQHAKDFELNQLRQEKLQCDSYREGVKDAR